MASDKNRFQELLLIWSVGGLKSVQFYNLHSIVLLGLLVSEQNAGSGVKKTYASVYLLDLSSSYRLIKAWMS